MKLGPVVASNRAIRFEQTCDSREEIYLLGMLLAFHAQ